MPTKEEIELETLKRNSPYALPDDTAASGWTSAQVKEKFYAGLLYLYDLFKTYRDSVGGDVGEIADKVDALTEEIEGFIANESATTDDEGNVIKTTYAKIAAIEGGTVAAAKYIKADSTRESIYAIEPRIMAIIAVLQGYFTNGKANTAALADKAVADGSGQNIEQTYEKKGSIAGLQASINGILNGTSTVGKALSDGSGNPISTTYETKADALSKVSAANLRTAIGLATTSLAGLMGPEDKSRLDALYALLNSDEDADEVVNTINEVLAVFDQYPEGVSLANALALKVDKVAGKGLSTEDYTSAEKTKLQGIENGAQVNTVTSVAGKTGAVTLSKSDVGLSNVDNTSDLNKPISTATQTALNTKQDTLVSGTNIKTVNGVSLLGSGDIAIEVDSISNVEIEALFPDSILGNNSWEVLKAFSLGVTDKSEIPSTWLGTVKYFTYLNRTYEARLVDTTGKHTRVSDGSKAWLLFEVTELNPTSYQFNSTNSDIVADSPLLKSFNNTDGTGARWLELPSNLRAVLEDVNVLVGPPQGNTPINLPFKVFFGREADLFSIASYSKSVEFNAITQDEYYQSNNTNAARIKCEGGTTTAYVYQLMSINSSGFICVVSSSGTASYGNINGSRRVAFRFAI